MVSRWPKSPFGHQDLFSGIDILQSVVQHLDCLLPGINQCVPFFWGSTSCKMEVKEDLVTKKKIKNLDTPKKTSRYQLKEFPESLTLLKWGCVNSVVGLELAEATIKIKSFRRGAPSNVGNTCFWQRSLTEKQLLQEEKARKTAKTRPQSGVCKQPPEGPSTEDPATQESHILIVVGFFTTEATIKSKHS